MFDLSQMLNFRGYFLFPFLPKQFLIYFYQCTDYIISPTFISLYIPDISMFLSRSLLNINM